MGADVKKFAVKLVPMRQAELDAVKTASINSAATPKLSETEGNSGIATIVPFDRHFG
jgi:hypothetical protein